MTDEKILKSATRLLIITENSSTTIKLTEWIPGDIKPIRIGVYQRIHDRGTIAGSIQYSYWNGVFWGLFGNTPGLALIRHHLKSISQNLSWRGLSEELK